MMYALNVNQTKNVLGTELEFNVIVNVTSQRVLYESTNQINDIALDLKRRYVFAVDGQQVVAIKAKHSMVKVKSIYNLTNGLKIGNLELDTKKKNLFWSGVSTNGSSIV